jgi:hypothetical protein
MATLRDQVLQLYTPIYDEFMLESFAEESQIHPQIFDSVDDKTMEYKVDGLGGLGLWEDAEEGEGGQYDDPVLGYPKTFTQENVASVSGFLLRRSTMMSMRS